MNRNSARLNRPILIALASAIAPHALTLPAWINAWCLVLWGYMFISLKTGWPLPGFWIRIALALVGLTGLLATFHIRLGSDAFVGLMAIMAAIKPFEMPTHRHRMVTLLLTYFIIITSLLRSDSLWVILYMFFSVFVTTTALVRINHPQGKFRDCVGLAGRALAQAIPLTVVLFLVFPRLQDGFFGVKDPGSGVSGFSEILRPGSVSNLALDRTLAFRAAFDGPLPPADALYWRGIVFSQFDGEAWRPATQPTAAPGTGTAHGDLYAHTVILEAHQSRWLVALDRPVTPPPGTYFTRTGTIKSRVPVRKKKTYQAVSALDRPVNPDDAPLVLAIPAHSNPKTQRLARALARGTDTETEKINRILQYFKENHFTYTLSPARVFGNPVDHFVFTEKSGYCGHFASALAFMMNAVNVPARVVGGYLGGEFNPYGNYLSVRRSLAHAWTEVFVKGKGWIRVDPTLAVAPERIFRNPDGSAAYGGAAATDLSVLKKLDFFLAAVNLRWESWFTGYSYFGQLAILERLGFGKRLDTFHTTVILLVMTGGVLTVFALFFFRRHGAGDGHRDGVGRAYDLFCRRMGKAGIRRDPAQGPDDFARSIIDKRPDLAGPVTAITDLYIRLRFREQPLQGGRPALVSRLIRMVKRFDPKHKQ